MRRAALGLVAVAAGAGAWPACGTSGSGKQQSAEVDPGPTFGVEVTVAIKGRGRVVSDPTALDCPSNCFARIVLADPKPDGSDLGLALNPEATIGSHFAGWSYESVDVGVRGRGPSQCSPMTRTTTVLPWATTDPTRLAVHYGETRGRPPAGLEAECAAFTTVPVAYSLTATFEENDVVSVHPTPGPPIEVLFEPPALGIVVGREIGVTGGRVYWRFDKNGLSGIASGPAAGTGGGSIVNVQPFESIQRFHVDRHVLFQRGVEGNQGYLDSIHASTGVRATLGYLYYPCLALGSDESTAFCRANGGSVTYLYSSPIGGGGLSYLYSLPRGADLALDGQHLYFSDQQLDGLQGQATVERAPRFPDGGGGTPVITKLVFGQTQPHELAVGTDYLFWLDDRGGNVVTATTAPKAGVDGGNGLPRAAPSARFVALDPTSPTTFWIGVPNGTKTGDSAILKASALSSGVTTFRSGLTGVGGIAVDATHVYWTQNDGRVYRAPKE